jgi:hypothetical protein
MGNWVAYGALAAWPMITIWLYMNKSVTEATLWVILGGHMFLPVRTNVDLPMIPPFDKESIPALFAFLGCRFIAGRKISFWGKPGWVTILLIMFVLGPFITAELNQDATYSGGKLLQPMEHYDAISAVINQLIVIIPFFLGRQLFRNVDDHELMFRTLIMAGLCYSVLMLFEVRMSPQLNRWIYGFFPHSFAQQMRFGGFRPVVFMGHGLLVSFFAVVTLIAASVFWQMKIKIRRLSSSGITFYLLLVLLLCKSVASYLYGFASLYLIKFSSFKIQLKFAQVLVLLALLYPTLSITNLFPHQAIMNWALSMDADRAQSLGVRFDNEYRLLNHAKKRFIFGWGTWGRNRIYSEDTAKDITITDGRWIITFGQFGWVGFIAEFGLLAISVFKAVKAFKYLKIKRERCLLSAHALLVGIVMTDQLPNSSLSPWLWLLTGILLSRAEAIIALGKKPKANNAGITISNV